MSSYFSLTDYISKIPVERKFAISDNEVITYGELRTKIAQFGKNHSYLRGRNCAVIAGSRYDLAVHLPCVEKLASSILLQPEDLDDGVAREFYKKASIDYVVNIINGVVKVTQTNFDIKEKSLTPVDIETKWLLATSGTTGTPKLASYKLESLMSTTRSNIDIGKTFRWGLCYDVNRFAGLQVYLQTIASGSSLVTPVSDSLLTVIDLFAANNVNAMSATPSFWRKILMAPGSNTLTLRRITLGGEVSDQSILNALYIQYPKAKIVHIYASTEAGVGFAVKDGKAGFSTKLLDGTVSDSSLFKVDDGCLWIKSKNGAGNLLNGELVKDSEGYINTGDLVEISGDRIYFLGRASGTINVGGNKVMPEEIETVLNAFPEIVLSRVSGKKNSLLGALVTAEIVLSQGEGSYESKEMKKEILEHCNRNLLPFKVPVILKVVNNIPTNKSGKIVRVKS